MKGKSWVVTRRAQFGLPLVIAKLPNRALQGTSWILIFVRRSNRTFNYGVQNPQEMVFLEQYHNSTFQTVETEAVTLDVLAPIVNVFQTAVETGEIKNIPFEMLSAFVYDVTVAHAKRHISGALVMDASNLEIAVQACWDAIKAY